MKVENTIHIDAAPATVWAVTEDVERWPDWCPTMTSVRRVDDGPFRPGSSARIRQPGMPEAVWTVIDMEPGSGFAWEARVRGMRMVGRHRMEPDGAGTRSVLTVEMRGVPALFLWPLLRVAVGRAIARENAALRRRCESRPEG